ncbi:MAG: TlpA family protein disulfide reductase [Acidobacteria bacterium]|nr:TlpA family protein disulfide reductase [Acidobacteriota bacterium]
MSKLKAMIFLAALCVGLTGCAAGERAAGDTAATTNTTSTAARETADTAGAGGATTGTAVGNLAPQFQLVQTDGAQVSLDSLRGHPAVVVFWTAWCPFCKEEAPHINELAAQYEARGVRVLGINIQDSEARTAGGVREFGIKYAVARDADAKIAKLYKVQGTPTVIFLDKQGVVRYNGNELPKDYAAQLDALL